MANIPTRNWKAGVKPAIGFPEKKRLLRSDPVNSQEGVIPSTGYKSSLEHGDVLVVDDDVLSLGLMSDLLSMNGYSVSTAANGDEAIDIFLAKRPDVVITDIMMPLTNGLELLSKVGEIDETAPVILVTGHGDLDNAIGALRRGAHDFLVKPINAEMLLNTVSKAMELGRLKKLERNYTRILEERVQERTRELAKTNDFLAGILESSRGVSIVLADLEGKILFWNSGAENLYGYKAEEIMGTSVHTLYPDQRYAEEIFQNIAHMENDGMTVFQQNTKQVSKDGRNLTVFLTMSYMLDGAGKVRGILSLGKDVTEQVMLHEELLESYRRITKIQNGFIFALAKLAESRDEETSLHLRRIQAYCRSLCRKLAQKERHAAVVTDSFIENLVQGAILHDIGKVGLPDAILFTVEKFTPEEFETMKLHTIKGGEALLEAAEESGEKEGYLTIGKDVAYYHHEQWDGSGYPFGLKGSEIPLSARIVAVSDVYDALTTARRYKRAFTHEEACEHILLAKGRQFDPEIVGVFEEAQDEFKQIRDSFSVEASVHDR